MVNPEERQYADGERDEGIDRPDQISDGQDLSGVSSSSSETLNAANESVTMRLREIFEGDGDTDLLLQRSDREDDVIQWLRALDMQVMGACRADERLKPLLKFNLSTGLAEDGLLAHLSQHFELSEVGMLARCLCIPLVSIRVGRIDKQGTTLSPTSIRGNLCLALLPNSDLHISFSGDDGSMERLAALSSESQCADIEIEQILADTSGRSFFIRTLEAVFYFWCSEKSKLLGDELLKKMKDLLIKKPSLAELTGIHESRLDCFGTQIRAYLAGSVATSSHTGAVISAIPSDDSADSYDSQFPQSSFNCQKGSRVRQSGGQGSKTSLIYQCSLSPRSSSFKESMQKNLSTARSNAREKFRRRGENYISMIDSFDLSSPQNVTDFPSSSIFTKDKLPVVSAPNSFAGFDCLDVFRKSTEFPVPSLDIGTSFSGSSQISPHYCWCPPVASALQFTMGHPPFPCSSAEPFTLPPLSSLLSPSPLLNLADLPPLDFPSMLPEPLVKLSASQQIPTFTPLICDSIVHIPLIDVCSSGQGYLVSAGPAMPISIAPLNANLIEPRLPKSESILEKNARETLRMLTSASNLPNPQLLDVFPRVLSSTGHDLPNVFAAGSRGFYSGTRDVDALTNSMSSFGLVLFEKPMASISKEDDMVEQEENPPSSDEGTGTP